MQAHLDQERGFYLDPNVLLTVMGSFRPGTSPGPDGVVGYFQSAFQAGFTVALQSVAGFQDYSMAVYQCTDPTGGTHQSGWRSRIRRRGWRARSHCWASHRRKVVLTHRPADRGVERDG